MHRTSRLALTLSLLVAVAILAGGLVPRSLGDGAIRHDGPLIHGAAFACLVLPLTAVWPSRWLAIAVAAIAFGGLLEGLQGFVDRAPQWSDILANVGGTLLGTGAGLALSRLMRRRS